MKKSISALLVIIISFIGANSWASVLDRNVEKNTKEVSDSTSTMNDGKRKCSKISGH